MCFVCTFSRLLVCSFASFFRLCICPSVLDRSFDRSFLRSFVLSFICSFICSFVPSFVHLFVCSFVPSFVLLQLPLNTYRSFGSAGRSFSRFSVSLTHRLFHYPQVCILSIFSFYVFLFSQLFLDNLESFINQVESVNFINLFLTDLKYEFLSPFQARP